jgi:hypothetical protein
VATSRPNVAVSFQISVFVSVTAPPAATRQEMKLRTKQLENLMAEEYIIHLSDRVNQSAIAVHTLTTEARVRISAGTHTILSIFLV